MARRIASREDALPGLAATFRDAGFEGASLDAIVAATGLGRGSLYHFFPGGKREMAEAVLDHVEGWFETQVFTPLRTLPDPHDAIGLMLDNVAAYFENGGRICLVGALALADSRDLFADRIERYFAAWIEALAGALERSGQDSATARTEASLAVALIQGVLVLSRSLRIEAPFADGMAHLRRLLSPNAGRAG